LGWCVKELFASVKVTPALACSRPMSGSHIAEAVVQNRFSPAGPRVLADMGYRPLSAQKLSITIDSFQTETNKLL